MRAPCSTAARYWAALLPFIIAVLAAVTKPGRRFFRWLYNNVPFRVVSRTRRSLVFIPDPLQCWWRAVESDRAAGMQVHFQATVSNLTRADYFLPRAFFRKPYADASIEVRLPDSAAYGQFPIRSRSIALMAVSGVIAPLTVENGSDLLLDIGIVDHRADIHFLRGVRFAPSALTRVSPS